MTPDRNDSGLTDAELAALAEGLLRLDAARQYGLIEGGPKIDVEHCEAVLARLAREGVVPTDEQANASAIEFMAQVNTEAPGV